jgi:hypothetical protein
MGIYWEAHGKKVFVCPKWYDWKWWTVIFGFIKSDLIIEIKKWNSLFFIWY